MRKVDVHDYSGKDKRLTRMIKDGFSLVAEIIGRPELLKLAETSAEDRVCPANVQRMQAILLRSPTKNFVILLMEKKTRPEKERVWFSRYSRRAFALSRNESRVVGRNRSAATIRIFPPLSGVDHIVDAFAVVVRPGQGAMPSRGFFRTCRSHWPRWTAPRWTPSRPNVQRSCRPPRARGRSRPWVRHQRSPR